MSKAYMVNEIFYSLQGEGLRAGTPNVFIRFSGCNLQCSVEDPDSGFDCDTEFTSGRKMNVAELVDAVFDLWPTKDSAPNVIFTGGEPMLQLDEELVAAMRMAGYYLAIETNGTKHIPFADLLDWICCSPKSAEHTMRLAKANELKYVRNAGQGIPKPSIVAYNFLISPAFDASGMVSRATLEHCIQLVKDNPKWRLSMQLHKLWRVR